ncbi:hypothetical protein M3Y97_00962000 [Aphelenchoides bicaudatus]|nr:hypothetical protein M3Y97_00962000 [Aphelenchoides bicaudatus]
MNSSHSSQQQQAGELPAKYRFDPNDKFYLAPPMCSLLHYRHGAILAGALEVACLAGGVFGFINLHSERGLTELWALLVMIVFLVFGCITTSIMLARIASMSLGIEWTNKLFSPFISVPDMENNFGPIWPFNVAIICFSGAALGIWFHLTIQGCQDYLLDKKYFQGHEQLPMELRQKAANEAERNQQMSSSQ